MARMNEYTKAPLSRPNP